MMIKNWKKEILTIPNLLSIFRLTLIPVYISIYLNASSPADYYLAATILAISCLTDLVDGKIARQYNMITTLGKILDPLADKATQLTLILCLAVVHPVLWYLVVLFVIKESFQLIAGGIALKRGKILKGAQYSGKICTTVLFVSLIIMVMLPTIEQSFVVAITVADLLVMSAAFLDYLITYLHRTNKFQDISISCDGQ